MLVENRKKLYYKTLEFVAHNTLYIFAWAFSGFGYFWPVWPMLVYAVHLIAYAYKLGLWTDEHIQDMIGLDDTVKSKKSKSVNKVKEDKEDKED